MKNFKNLWSEKNRIDDFNRILITPEKIIKINPDSQVTLKNNNIYIENPVFVNMDNFLKVYNTKDSYRYGNGYLTKQNGVRYKFEPVEVNLDTELYINTDFKYSHDYESISELFFNIEGKNEYSRPAMHAIMFYGNEITSATLSRLTIKYEKFYINDKILIPFRFLKQVKKDFNLSYKKTDNDNFIVRLQADDEELFFKIEKDFIEKYPDYHSIIPTDVFADDVSINLRDKRLIDFLKEGKRLHLPYCLIQKNKIVLSGKYKDEDEDNDFKMELDFDVNYPNKMEYDSILFDTNFILDAATVTDNFYIKKQNRPAVSISTDEKYKHVVMPMRA